MTRDEIQALFDRRLDALQRRDVEALARDYSESCVVESPFAGTVIGRAAIENVSRAFLVSFPDLTISNPELIVDGDRVVQMMTMSGTNSGGFMNLPPTGKRFSFTIVFVATLMGSQIGHETRIYDFTRFLMEIGVLKARPV